jgi:CRISPR-associated protein Csb2
MSHLCVTVRWLDDRYHGLLNRDGPPEWPPSPFRLFQALVAGAARHGELNSGVGKSLGWLESLVPPLIFAPRACPGQIVQRFVPNNDGDTEPDRQMRLTGKTSRPTIMLGVPKVHYLWPTDRAAPEAQGVIQAARCLSCLGWGIDMAYGDGQILEEEEVGKLGGIRWFPKPNTLREDGLLRVPKGGSMTDLMSAHQSALNRIEHGKPLRTVEKPQVFDRVFYMSTERPLGLPYVVFALRNDRGDYRYQHAKLIHIAGMARNASISAMKAFPPNGIADAAEWVKAFVAGHRSEGQVEHRQLSYVPLPSIGHEHADAMIRRVMITAPFGCEGELRHLADQLDGEYLQPEGEAEKPALDRLLFDDGVTRQYAGSSKIWASVTPVILPGHDDHKPDKTSKLIERALVQSGIEQGCQYTWGSVPNFHNCLTASKYDLNGRRIGYFRPDHLSGLTAVHIRITFEHPVAGPLAIGAGRHCGLGVLAAVKEA